MSDFPEHLRGLLRPQAYPHAVRAVEVIETHVSWVLLTGTFAYKIKRPVHYPFIDLRSAARRAFLCHEEVRLNRRFAPDLYVAVCPVFCVDAEACLVGSGRPIEHAVKMQQFPVEDQLDKLLEGHRIEPVELESFGRELARIHARLPLPRPGQSWGRPAALRAVILDNAAQCARLAGEAAATVGAIRSDLERLLDEAMPQLSVRFASGHVRECHGDLHAGNIVRRHSQLLAFDCLEFDPALRWTDVADEISFLLADLEARHTPFHAQAFLAGYLAESGDYPACALAPIFKIHRALVRAKVALLGAAHGKAGASSADAARQFETYVDCVRRTKLVRPPILVLMCGLSGSGKTWLAQRLTPRLLGVHLRSDIERKRIAGLPVTERAAAGPQEGLYSREAIASVYQHLAECAHATLAGGYPTIVDATFGQRTERTRFIDLAARLGIKVCIVQCRASHEVLRARVLAREQDAKDASDADLSILAWQERHFEPLERQEAATILDCVTDEPGLVERLVDAVESVRR